MAASIRTTSVIPFVGENLITLLKGITVDTATAEYNKVITNTGILEGFACEQHSKLLFIATIATA